MKKTIILFLCLCLTACTNQPTVTKYDDEFTVLGLLLEEVEQEIEDELEEELEEEIEEELEEGEEDLSETEDSTSSNNQSNSNGSSSDNSNNSNSGSSSDSSNNNSNSGSSSDSSTGSTGTTTSTVNYYGVTILSTEAEKSNAVAKSIANSVLGNSSYTTDLDKVYAAAKAVAGYCNKASYTTDSNKYYRTPYGVFVAGVYTCAGSTRALGLVLDYMGYSWSHKNENGYSHQWCIVKLDGQTGFADGMGGFAGYGEMYSGMVLPDGSTIYF